MENLREKLLKIVRKTLRDGYLSEELDELIDQVMDELKGRSDATK